MKESYRSQSKRLQEQADQLEKKLNEKRASLGAAVLDGGDSRKLLAEVEAMRVDLEANKAAYLEAISRAAVEEQQERQRAIDAAAEEIKRHNKESAAELAELVKSLALISFQAQALVDRHKRIEELREKYELRRIGNNLAVPDVNIWALAGMHAETVNGLQMQLRSIQNLAPQGDHSYLAALVEEVSQPV